MDSDDEIPTLVTADVDDAPALPPVVTSSSPRQSGVPLTIISGFLGAGKSTLLRRILTERHGYRIAVIMNEFGDTANIEAKAINVSSEEDPTAEKSEEFLELANGCLCCSIKDAGVAAIEKLMERKGAFDHILLETTGLADPGPIAAMFWKNEEYGSGLGHDILLDGVVIVVDVVFGKQQVEEDNTVDGIGESIRQIACADVIILNKVDLVSKEQLHELEGLIRTVNASAPIHRTVRAELDLKHIMNIGAFNTARPIDQAIQPVSSHDHDHDHEHDGDDHHHDTTPTHYELRGISSLQVSVPVLSAERLDRLDEWIRTLLWENRLPGKVDGSDAQSSLKVLRCKGLFVTEKGEQYVLQGVQNLYDLSPVEGTEMTGVPDAGKLVLIGKGLTEEVRESVEKIFTL